jgi:hypothetical protein
VSGLAVTVNTPRDRVGFAAAFVRKFHDIGNKIMACLFIIADCVFIFRKPMIVSAII